MGQIHERLKKYRSKRGLTIKQVSQMTGIPESTYKEWENGRQIRGEPYLSLANAYQVSIQELLTGEKSQANHLLEQLDEITRLLEQTKRDLNSLF